MYNLLFSFALVADCKYINIMDFVFPLFWHFLGELTLKGIFVLFSFVLQSNIKPPQRDFLLVMPEWFNTIAWYFWIFLCFNTSTLQCILEKSTTCEGGESCSSGVRLADMGQIPGVPWRRCPRLWGDLHSLDINFMSKRKLFLTGFSEIKDYICKILGRERYGG